MLDLDIPKPSYNQRTKPIYLHYISLQGRRSMIGIQTCFVVQVLYDMQRRLSLFTVFYFTKKYVIGNMDLSVYITSSSHPMFGKERVTLILESAKKWYTLQNLIIELWKIRRALLMVFSISDLRISLLWSCARKKHQWKRVLHITCLLRRMENVGFLVILCLFCQNIFDCTLDEMVQNIIF